MKGFIGLFLKFNQWAANWAMNLPIQIGITMEIHGMYIVRLASFWALKGDLMMFDGYDNHSVTSRLMRTRIGGIISEMAASVRLVNNHNLSRCVHGDIHVFIVFLLLD